MKFNKLRKREKSRKRLFIKAIAMTLVGAIVIVGGLNTSLVKSTASSSEIIVENVDVKENADGSVETTVETSDGVKAIAVKNENNIDIYEYDADGELINESNFEVSDTEEIYKSMDITNDEYDYLDKYVIYKYESKSFDFIDKNIARSELTDKEYEMIEEHLKYVNQKCLEDLSEQIDNTENITRGNNKPTLEWYGVHWKMSNKKVKQLVNIAKEASSLAGATAGILAAIPACQQAAVIAGVIAGVLYLGGAAVQLLNKLGGNKGLHVRFYHNHTFTCTPF